MLKVIWKAYHMYWIKYHNSCRNHHFRQRDMHWDKVRRKESE